MGGAVAHLATLWLRRIYNNSGPHGVTLYPVQAKQQCPMTLPSDWHSPAQIADCAPELTNSTRRHLNDGRAATSFCFAIPQLPKHQNFAKNVGTGLKRFPPTGTQNRLHNFALRDRSSHKTIHTT